MSKLNQDFKGGCPGDMKKLNIVLERIKENPLGKLDEGSTFMEGYADTVFLQGKM